MAGASSQHHPPGAAGGAAAGAGAAVTPAAASAGPGDDSSDSEAEQEGPQKLIRKVSTSGQIRTKVRRALGQRGRREASGRGRGARAPGVLGARAGDPGNVGRKVRAGPDPGAGPGELDRRAAGRDSRPRTGGRQGGLPGAGGCVGGAGNERLGGSVGKC